MRSSFAREADPGQMLHRFTPVMLAVLWSLGIASHPARSGPPVSSAPLSEQPGRLAIHRGLHWLVQQQSLDGGWHSTTYGKMKTGAGNTALILYALSQLPPDIRDEARVPYEQGIRFLKSGFNPPPKQDAHASSIDYPIYSTALLLSAIQNFPPHASDETLQRQLIQILLAGQRTTANHWPAEHPENGGWGAWNDPPNQADSPNPANVSVTKLALEALQSANALTPEVRTSASAFLKRCQSPTGIPNAPPGFLFTPVLDSPLNKAGWLPPSSDPPQPRAYHSATCDGLLALHALGETTADTLIALSQTPSPHLAQLPLSETEIEPVQSALYFYDAAVMTQAWQLTHAEQLDAAYQSMRQTLQKHQRPDGSWSNPLPWYHEDDPLIATALALIALTPGPTR